MYIPEVGKLTFFLNVRKITNPQILGLIPLLQIRNFHDFSAKLQIRKFLNGAAQLCL
jgi:hypothetical protein